MLIKCEIRAESISYASWKAKQLREQGLMLEKKLKRLEDIINDGDVTALYEYKETKQAFAKFNEKNSQGILLDQVLGSLKKGKM